MGKKNRRADVTYYYKKRKVAESSPATLDILVDLTERYGGTISNVYEQSKKDCSYIYDAWEIMEKYIEKGCGELPAEDFFYIEKFREVAQGHYQEIHSSAIYTLPNLLSDEEKAEYQKRKAERRSKRNARSTDKISR